MELLALGLNFGLTSTQSKFPLVEYVTATEDLCQKLEKVGVNCKPPVDMR